MSAASIKKRVDKFISLFKDFIPEKTYLYFPLISSALAWAHDRIQKRRESLLAWKVWPEPGPVKTKPDEYIQDFFSRNPGLAHSFRTELDNRRIKDLRSVFERLYPLLGTEDPFLKALFARELEAGDYRRIVSEFDTRVSQARSDIAALEEKAGFWKALRSLARETASLGIYMISQEDIQKMIVELVKEKRGDNHEG